MRPKVQKTAQSVGQASDDDDLEALKDECPSTLLGEGRSGIQTIRWQLEQRPSKMSQKSLNENSAQALVIGTGPVSTMVSPRSSSCRNALGFHRVAVCIVQA